MTTDRLYYHVTHRAHSPGEIKPRGTFGKSLMKEDVADELGERLREEVRFEHYPHLPSRFNSSFVFENIEDAVLFRDGFRPGASIYRVRFVEDPPALHRVCYTAWQPHPNPLYLAHQFWGNPPIYDTRTELFAEVDIEVVDVVELGSESTRTHQRHDQQTDSSPV